ncbi:MAG TPA: succinylglutamate desuccinylase [Acidobacteriota bacterium]|nr:succinylglutamate desuccinylase [Acidobacteriota bacterium]
MRRNAPIKTVLAAAFAGLVLWGGLPLLHHRRHDIPIVKGPGVTAVLRLSEYSPGLKGTPGDTNIYVLQGREPGGKALLMGDTHSNEPEGMLSAVIVIENGVVERGTLYVIPVFNNSGSRNTRPGDGYPLYFDVATDWGKRRFRFGNRDASPLDQWPDPDVYIHYPERQLLSYIDIRNTNRTWPGRADGPLMEKVTFGAMELMRREKIDVAIDVHGAETMFPVTNCIVAPESSVKIATLASLTVKAKEGFENHVEPSPAGFRGLSHREIGDHGPSLPFLLEAPIPFLDQPTGPKTTKFLLDGKDPFLLSLSKKKKLFVPYDETGWPLEKRVGQNLSVTLEILRQFSKKAADRTIAVRGVPRYADLVKSSVGRFLADPSKAPAGGVVMN